MPLSARRPWASPSSRATRWGICTRAARQVGLKAALSVRIVRAGNQQAVEDDRGSRRAPQHADNAPGCWPLAPCRGPQRVLPSCSPGPRRVHRSSRPGGALSASGPPLGLMGGAFDPGHQGGGDHAVEGDGGSPGSAAACRQRCWLLAARFLVGSAADLAALAERAAVWASALGHLPAAPITPSCGRRPALPLATGWPALEHRRARLGQATTQPQVRERFGA